MQQLQLAQPQYRHNPYQQQPHHTAVVMTPQVMDMPHRSASAPMTYQQPQQPMQPAQQQQVAIPLQQSTTQQLSYPYHYPMNAIQQSTSNKQPLGTSEPTAIRPVTDDDFRKMESKLELMMNKFHQMQDQKQPPVNILATLTRHENGMQPQYVPVDHRLAIIPAIVQSYRCNALFDTGSSVTVAPIAMADILKIQLEDSDRSITAVTGHTAEVTKKGQVRLTIAGHTRDVEMFFTANPLGSRNHYDFIIGVDVMRSFPKFTLDVHNYRLTMSNHTICWRTQPIPKIPSHQTSGHVVWNATQAQGNPNSLGIPISTTNAQENLSSAIPLKCNLCRRRGHKSSNCWFNQNSNSFDPNAKKGPSQTPNRTSVKRLIKQVFDAKHKDNPDAKLCYRCTEEGHNAKECPTFPKQSNQRTMLRAALRLLTSNQPTRSEEMAATQRPLSKPNFHW
jgi:hypothetical protein